MKYNSVFDIIGPIMIGPSSSHTAGAAIIGRLARSVFGRMPKIADIHLYGSFAETYKGHATDVAIVGGLLDFDTNDERIPQSLHLAREAGMEVAFHTEEAVPEHPNTTMIHLEDEHGSMEIIGVSIGGGKVEITELNGFKLKLNGMYPAILVLHDDRFGVISGVTNILTKHRVNIGHMEVSRKEKGKMALMVIEVDQNLQDSILDEIRGLEHVTQVTRMSP
ncbi:L-serine ammonia-lyase, iron-sulfur-dependent, subunit beta [Paenibacillus selenitireducens]|uniref:L-serine deaminase n=1 Tax=Paenibacillus selenitireducens TaxID=1324314 RepID=A0A1T2X847_9BACL|nr:L-serine ammonia-lyase, iron-sulfur-dependent subunit beta [Paenibacillus selenitireducens]OPA75763.1 L-serine ammonia-lyase, iron-sulfur-dependent, subunit beta [Paenibacillus selenitireducens]